MAPDTPAATIALEADRLGSELHVWLAVPEQSGAPEQASRCWQVLSAEERARAERFRFEPHRRTYVVAHALLRSALSSYAEVAPEHWSFAANAHGRPHVAGPARGGMLRFNLSHTSGLVACAVARERDIGCDVEDLARAPAVLELAERYFSAPELRDLRELGDDPGLQKSRFLEYWTLKEAYLKARGVGLRLPLDRFAFGLGPDRAIRARFWEPLEDAAENWQFALRRPTARHVLALAIERAADPLEIRTRFCVPLAGALPGAAAR